MSLSFFRSSTSSRQELEEITQNLRNALAPIEQVLLNAMKAFIAGSNGAKQGDLIAAALDLIKKVNTTIQAQEAPTPAQTPSAPSL
jgi:hypothetical protein